MPKKMFQMENCTAFRLTAIQQIYKRLLINRPNIFQAVQSYKKGKTYNDDAGERKGCIGQT